MYNWDNTTMMARGGDSMMGYGSGMGAPQIATSLKNIETRQPPSPPQSTNQIYYIPGRGVDSPDEVKAFEVPMDCPISVFPNNNRKQIYVKYWDSKGNLATDIYNLAEETEHVDAQADTVNERLRRIEEMLTSSKRINNNYYGKHNRYKYKGGNKNDQNTNSSGQSNN